MIYSPNLSLNLNKKSGQTVLELRFVTKKRYFPCLPYLDHPPSIFLHAILEII